MFVALELLVVLGGLPVLILVLRQNAARAAAGYPAWTRYRARDPNAVKSDGSVDWTGRNEWDESGGDAGSDSSAGADVHGAADAGGISGDVGGGHEGD
jgi:hypothetical protein